MKKIIKIFKPKNGTYLISIPKSIASEMELDKVEYITIENTNKEEIKITKFKED